MSSNNTVTPGQIFFRLACAAGALYAGHCIYQKHFKGKSSEEIESMVEDAFKKLEAIIGIIHEASHILQETFQTFQSEYISLSTNNITSEKMQRITSLCHHMGTLLEDKSEAKDPIEIIDESIQIIAEKNGINQLA